MIRAIATEPAPELTDIQRRILADLDELRAAVLAHPDAASFSSALIYPANDGTGNHTTHGTWQVADHIPVQTHVGALHYMLRTLKGV